MGSDVTEPPRSTRPSPDPGHAYGVSQVAHAKASRMAAKPPGSAGSANGRRPSSIGATAGRAAVGSRPSLLGPEVTRTSVFSYLRVHGLQQYAKVFIEAGLGDLEAIGRLSEAAAMAFLERIKVHPGHRTRLLRAVDTLRRAASGAERRDAAQMLEDDAALERLCEQKEKLSQAKLETESENHRLQEEISRLVGIVRQQDAELQKSRDRVAELEELVQSQTDQVNFLAQQLQNMAENDPTRENELYRSYKDSFNDWGSAQKITLPETLAGDLLNLQELEKATQIANKEATPPRRPPPASKPPTGLHDLVNPPQISKAKLAHSLDSAQITECLAGFDVDHVIKCLSVAIQNKIIPSTSKSRPHTASSERLAACAIFLEPKCKDKLLRQSSAPASPRRGLAEGATELSFCSPLMSRDPHMSGSFELRDSLGKLLDPLNNLAVRVSPSKWDIYGFLRDVMVNFRLQPEVSVITLFYLDRFTEVSGVAITPDNWQRLTITAMMLASKVWDDESYENPEFAQLCPLYTIDEINTFERVFLKSVGYNMSVKGSQYAKTYFLLRTLGAKDNPDFGVEPLDALRASRLTERCLQKQIEFRERYADDIDRHALNWTM